MRSFPVIRSLVPARIAAVVVVFCAMATAAVAIDAQDTISPSPPTTTLVTRLGDRLPGRWLAAEKPEAIEWQVDGFVDPFQFDQQYLAAIQVRHTVQAPPVAATYRCELASGDVLLGTPVAIDDTRLEFDVPHAGLVRINRHHLQKLSPLRNGAETVGMTPTALNDWQGDHDNWQDVAGRITARVDNSELIASLTIGSKSHISLALGWRERPDFRIDFGSNAEWDTGLRLETWQDQLVLVAESPTAASILLVKKLDHHAGELTLGVFVDTHQETILVALAHGQVLGEMKWQGEFSSRFRVHARKKGLHFRSAIVTPWDGSSPMSHDEAQPSVHYKDGKVESATVTSWDPNSQEWTFAASVEASDSAPREQQASSDQIDSLTFAGTGNSDPGAVQATSLNGMRLSGDLVKFTDQSVWLNCPGVEDPIPIPASNLRSLVFLAEADTEIEKSVDSVRLLLGDTCIVGRLVDGRAEGQASALRWKADSSRNAVTIANDASGTIVYRARTSSQSGAKKADNPGTQKRGFMGNLARLFSKQTSTTSSKQPQGSTLHLRSGDTIPCQPKRIDETGVTFSSPATEATFAPHQQIKALVLATGFQPARVTKEQRDRLLTLPRVQQEYPPTHLLLSVDGDLLRTRLLSMDDKLITTEVRLNPLSVPRSRVAAIAWLHKDELENGAAEEAAPNDSELTLRVQAVQADGIRLTFRLQEVADGIFLGKSDVFGNCHVASEVDELLFGQAIDEAVKHQSHQLLRLKPAIAPRFITADPRASTDAGQGSALVGKAAPPVRLKTLDGKRFGLEFHRGKVVVLDFWATWCGPCIQWMPQLEEIVSSYPEDEVELVTINLLQDKETIEPVLERMQINPTVLLDIDGVVADAYQATAIPQTVVIDQQGNVARVFIGGAPHLKQPLAEALDALTTNPPAK